MKKKANEFNTTVSGKVIDATVKTISDLGSLGDQVLARLEVSKIDLNKQYPFNLRTALFAEVLDRFGNHALYMCGVEIFEYFPEQLKKYVEYVETHRSEMCDLDNLDLVERNLSGLVELVTQHISNTLSQVTRSENKVVYGAQCKKVRQFEYQIICTQASELKYESYIRSSWEMGISLVAGDICDFNMIFNSEQSEEGGQGWATFVWDATIKPNIDRRSPTELTMIKVNKIRKEMLKEVFAYADYQTSKANSEKQKMESLSMKLGKYVPPQIHDALFSGKYDDQIATRRKKITIFFSDIANFTSTSEGLQPEDLTKYLNEYFSEMTAIALDCGATIDKYIGDAMMVFFGDPESRGEKNDARACVEMALRMQERMGQLQDKWSNEGFADPFQVRMGINSGYCNVGNFGSDQRLTYTIIGGEVNVAQRLESNAIAGEILLSYETYAHAQDMIEVQEKEAITMKGINREIKVFSIIRRKIVADNQKVKVMKKPTKRELSQIERLENDMTVMKKNIDDLREKIDIFSKKL